MSLYEKGIIKYINKGKGFGFIQRQSDGMAIYFKTSDVQDKNLLKVGEKIEFKSIKGDKFIQAIDLIVAN